MATFASDVFTDANGTDLNAHTPDVGGSWTKNQSTITIQSNRTQGSLFAGAYYSNNGTPNSADYDVSADITFVTAAGSGLAGVQARVAGGAHFNTYVALYDAGNNRYELRRYSAGALSSLGTSAYTYAQNETHTIKLRVNGSQITMFVDGVSLIDVSNGDISAAGLAGIYHEDSATHALALDNFVAGDIDSSIPAGAIAVTGRGTSLNFTICMPDEL